MITQERLHELLSYDPDTGFFMWKKKRSKAKVNSPAGVVNARGYIQIGIDKKVFLAHRLAWIYTYGALPAGQVDHINRVKTDNRLCNLRDVSPSENAQNRHVVSANKSGYKGVSWDATRGKWLAAIELMGRTYHLGRFVNLEDAVSAYAAGAALHHSCNPAAEAIA